MALDLFYFLSSLPTLRPGEKPPFSWRDFLSQCSSALPEGGYQRLASLSLLPGNSPAPQGVPEQWRQFETFLRNSLAEIRLGRFSKNSVTFEARETEFLSPGVKKKIEDATATAVPLERERLLDEVRWQFLDSLEAGQDFNQERLDVYALKLQLLEKQTSRRQDAGAQSFRELLQGCFQQANDRRSREEA